MCLPALLMRQGSTALARSSLARARSAVGRAAALGEAPRARWFSAMQRRPGAAGGACAWHELRHAGCLHRPLGNRQGGGGGRRGWQVGVGQSLGQQWEPLGAPSWPTRSFSTADEDDAERKLRVAGGQPAQVPLRLGVGPPRPLTAAPDKQAYQRELYTVTVAICANLVIFLAKLVTYLYSGSSAMLAETVHSVVDTFNQVLLRVGIERSRRAPTSQHPYGYLKDKFVWSLVSAVGIFCLGAGITTAHGCSNLMAGPQALENLGYGISVLGVSFIVEGYSLFVATRAVLRGAQAARLSFLQFVRRGLDPTSIAVMLEDGAAVAGLVIAGVATGVAHATGNSLYDAAGSICIGLLLGATAAFLIAQNRSLLIGRSMHPADMQRVMDYLRRDPIVRAIHDAKSEEIGPGIYRFKAELEFRGDTVVQRHMERLGGVERLHEQISCAVVTQRRESLDLALTAYGTDMIGALGAEVDRLEAEIQQLVPGIRHIDLETDRGRHDKGSAAAMGLYTVEADAPPSRRAI